ncbi:hypothetical protein VHUM_01320 [Vanrija humicola]|uniref:Protein SDA1 n=1 Tax=Vanrija humicola TaxID=5417 RepID=A0A7D8V2W6_VANHU|nr:hypothetical protein VHUM_01320 [Vanrija humicola]
MVKSRVSRGILLTNNLPQLQNLIKRDPVAYKEEFMVQYNHYVSLLRLQTVAPASGSSATSNEKSTELFGDLITFVSQCAACYPTITKELPQQLRALLLGTEGVMALTGDLRETAVRNLVMLRNKDVIDSVELLQTLLPLLPQVSKDLRSTIRSTILTDIKTSNQRTKNHRLNRIVQGLLFGMIESGMGGEVIGNKGKGKGKEQGGEAMWAVMMVRELWRKGVWTDAKTVSIAALAVFHPNTKVQSAAIHFFLGSDTDADREDDSSDEEDAVVASRRNVKGMEHKMGVGKHGRKQQRQLEKLKSGLSKKRKEKAAAISVNFPALELLNDPQTFGEKLYDNLSRYDKQYSLEHKVLIMQLLSRVMGAHKLCVLGFYTYIIKYLTYHQLQVTLILVALAQSVHELTPPDVLTPVIRKLAQEFVHPGVGAEVIAAGINSIREVCRRQPWCMEEDLLSDLIEYKKSKDKGVATAAGGLLSLFREVNPGLLRRRDRGKTASMGLIDGQVPEFGHTKEVPDGIDGLELLEEHFKSMRKEANGGVSDDEELEIDEDDEAGWDNWDVESEEDSDSDDWNDVSSDGEDFEISDSEDEDDKPKSKKARLAKKTEEDEDEDDDAKSVVSTATSTATEARKISLLAQQKILTPADFALLNELKLKAAQAAVEQGGGSAAKRKLAALEASKRSVGEDEQNRFLTEGEILGARKKTKQDYEERMESIRKGREGREKFGSMKGKKKKEAPSSTTNREKARNKPLMMAIHSNKVVQKKKASLRDKQMRLRAAVEKQKKSKF